MVWSVPTFLANPYARRADRQIALCLLRLVTADKIAEHLHVTLRFFGVSTVPAVLEQHPLRPQNTLLDRPRDQRRGFVIFPRGDRRPRLDLAQFRDDLSMLPPSYHAK